MDTDTREVLRSGSTAPASALEDVKSTGDGIPANSGFSLDGTCSSTTDNGRRAEGTLGRSLCARLPNTYMERRDGLATR